MKEGAITRRYELTAAPWRRLEALVPGKAGDRGRTAADHRTFVHGGAVGAVLWVRRRGAHWQHLPERYGHWQSTHTRCTRWAKAGGWERLFATLLADPKNHSVMIDATIVRALQQAAPGRGGTRARRWGVPEVD